MDRRRTNTRERIQEVALALFAEQGYENTSLREIAESLGVTKAALYYHFKTKEEILGSVFHDLIAAVDDLVAWNRSQPRSAATRREAMQRLSDLFNGKWRILLRFGQTNQTAMRDSPAGEEFGKRMQAIFDLVADPDFTLAEQLRARLAVAAFFLGQFGMDDVQASPDQKAAAALEVAQELAAGRPQPSAAAD